MCYQTHIDLKNELIISVQQKLNETYSVHNLTSSQK